MYNNPNRLRNIELPENLFSNLGETKKISSSLPKDELLNTIMANNEEVKLTNYSDKNEYRNRINKMYEDIQDITPVDNEIDNVIYFNNYIEKGIVVKPKISSLKQFWTEYRLIKNEKKTPIHHKVVPKTTPAEEVVKTEEKLNSFDELFEALSLRVDEINKYIDELKEMKSNIEVSNKELKENQEKLKQEKQKFMDFKQTEETKINKEKESLKINFARLQTIIDDLDKKLNEIDN